MQFTSTSGHGHGECTTGSETVTGPSWQEYDARPIGQEPPEIDLEAVAKALLDFMPGWQAERLLRNALTHEHARESVRRLLHTIATMPKTYEQDGKGKKAVAYLCYITKGAVWYITEKDMDTDGQGQIQAFGVAKVGNNPAELGYISIKELLELGCVALLLDFEPKTLEELGYDG